MDFHANNSYPCGLLTQETPYTRARKESKVKKRREKKSIVYTLSGNGNSPKF